jgi:hypothetical protein
MSTFFYKFSMDGYPSPFYGVSEDSLLINPIFYNKHRLLAQPPPQPFQLFPKKQIPLQSHCSAPCQSLNYSMNPLTVQLRH